MQRDINFFSVYHSSAAGYDKATIAGLSVLLGCVAVIAGIFVFVKIDDATVQAQNSSISRFMAQRNVISAASAVEAANQKIEYLKQYEALAGKNTKAFAGLSTLNTDLLNTIAQELPTDVAVIGLNYKDTTITLSCVAANDNSAAIFSNALTGSQKFDYVTYDGVVKSGSSFLFNITCTVKGGVSK